MWATVMSNTLNCVAYRKDTKSTQIVLKYTIYNLSYPAHMVFLAISKIKLNGNDTNTNTHSPSFPGHWFDAVFKVQEAMN